MSDQLSRKFPLEDKGGSNTKNEFNKRETYGMRDVEPSQTK